MWYQVFKLKEEVEEYMGTLMRASRCRQVEYIISERGSVLGFTQ